MKPSLTHFAVAALIVILLIVGYGVWFSAVANESAHVVDLGNQITAAHETIDRVTSARATLTEIAGDETKVQSYFVSETDAVALINDLEGRGLAHKATVSVLTVSAGGSPARPVLLISLTVNGTFEGVMRTIGSIEYAPYDISISKLSVARDGKDSWHAELGLTVGSTRAETATSTP